MYEDEENKSSFWTCFTIIVGIATVSAAIFAGLTYFDIKPSSRNSTVSEDNVLVEKEDADDTSFVDLGLSVKWHKCNLGASHPYESGDYYAWGEIEPQPNHFYDTKHYKWYKGSDTILSKYCEVDNKLILDYEDDPARRFGWRTPTVKEINELLSRCKWKWVKHKSVYGYKVTGPNGNSIFLPASGSWVNGKMTHLGEGAWYWSNECAKAYHYLWAYGFYFHENYVSHGASHWSKMFGCSIRPVCP